MILQPFVENSIRHGINQNENDTGEIRINISQNGKLTCIIEDNGIGRARSVSMKSDQPALYESKGLSLTLNRIDIINKIYDTAISADTQDITNDRGEIAGTRVSIQFPIDMG
jgi:LytS/YehU family sensor histidine kinase